MSLIRYYREVIDSLGGVMMPVFSRTEAAGDRDKLRAHLVRANRLCAAVAMFIGGSIALYGGVFIERWIGPGFRDSYSVTLILVGPFIVALAQNPCIYLLYGLSKQERLLRLNVIEAIVNFALSLALVSRYGIFGVAAGTAISLLITKTLLQPRILCEETGMPLRVYYLDALLVPLVITGVPMLLCHMLIAPWLRPDYLPIMAAVGLQALVAAPVVWLFILGKDTRASLAHAFARKSA
jgi:peptidoglycan biosynthesis protein MviN/MurJ (putative lipid II flippase)